MNSIFLRIYAGMLLAMVVVGFAVWGLLEVVNEHRAAVYREEMAKGTFTLLAEGASRYHGAERDKFLQVLSALLGSEVTLLPEGAVAFDETDRARFREKRVVFRVSEDENAADIYMRLPAEPLYLHTRMSRVSEQQARATVVLILDALGQHPPIEWDTAFAAIQQKFGFPLARMPLADVKLDKDQQERLLKSEVVISLANNDTAGQSVRIFAKIGNSGEALVVGPLVLLDQRPPGLIIALGVLALFLMGLAAYLLVRPLERRLKRMEVAVQQLARGDLSVRAGVQGSDAVGQLASSFNGMAAHIQRLIQSQREMTRAVSHELRTPVARIRFGLEMLADIDDAAVRQEKVAQIDDDIDELNELIDEILTYARLEEGAPALDWSPVDVAGLAAQVRRDVQVIAGSLALRVDAPAELVADGDERYLHRVLQNLVTNAIRYARQEIHIRVVLQGSEVELVVEDDGPGIPENQRERVFLPFARLDDSRHRASGGYGLGLSIVQRIAEWHSGRVWVGESVLGGAAFHLRWPQRRLGAHALSR